MAINEPKSVRTSISVTQSTKDIIDQLINGHVVNSFSEGLDKIVISWSRTKKGQEIYKHQN